MEHRLIMKVPRVAAISRYLLRQFEAFGKPSSQLRVYSMAVNPARFQRAPNRDELRRGLGWPEDVIVLGYIGSMNHYHRPTWFMELAEKFYRRDQHNVRFLVVGGSSSKVERYRGRLMKLVEEDRVRFVGSVPQEELGRWISVMDAVLVPGAAPQSTPTKIYESAAVGAPLILPATEPIEELCGKEAPYLFKPGEFKDFENRVRQFCQNPADFNAPAKELHERVLREHTWEQHARELVEWLQDSRMSPG
jgi:glycosyltransferase involved in cell wall biosynthesis